MYTLDRVLVGTLDRVLEVHIGPSFGMYTVDREVVGTQRTFALYW